jgi:DNA repair protein SbcC/Rad50
LSVFYFDASGMMTRGDFDPARYQEDLLADDFYANAGPLQWSYYLIFLLERESLKTLAVREFSRTVVQDDHFARKYVVPADELRDFVDRALDVDGELTASIGDVVDGWLKQLEPAGLNDIGRTPRTKLIARIKDGEVAPRALGRGDSRPRNKETLAGLKSLSVDAYRSRPPEGAYSLKRVNLLTGPNGSGKTSFLEAIELVLCGQTAASGEEVATLSLETFEGKKERYEPDNGARYRERDALWFGRSYPRGNELPKSFGRYVFFSSDAAYKLAYEDNGEVLNKAFTDLLLGGEATKTFDRIQALAKALGNERQELAGSLERDRTVLSERRADVLRLEGEMSQADNLASVQGAISAALGLADNLSPADALDVLSTAKRHLAHARRSADWLRPLSLTNLTAEKNRLETAAAAIASRRDSAATARAVAEQRSSSLQALREDAGIVEAAAEILRILAATPVDQLSAAKTDLPKLRERRGGLLRARDRLAAFAEDSDLGRKKPAEVAEQIDEAERELEGLKEQVGDIERTISQLAKLRRELANTGARIFDLLPEKENCPLCGQHYGRGVLERKITEHEAEDPAERILATTSEKVRSLEKELGTLRNAREATRQALAFLNATVEADGRDDPALSELIGRLDGEVARCTAEVEGLDPLLQKASALEQRGFTPEKVVEVLDRLRGLAPGEEANVEAWKLDGLRSRLSGSMASISEDLNDANKAAEAAESALQEATLDVFTGLREPKNVEDKALAQVRSIDEATEQLVAAQEIIRIDDSNDVTTLENRVVAYLEELRSALKFRTQLEESSATLIKYRAEIESLELRAPAQVEELNRVSDALSALDALEAESGLKDRLSEFLSRYKVAILRIFGQIHLPREFSDISLDAGDGNEILLTREADGAVARLDQISTGQRAALAISVFLALNRSVRDRVGILMIDDPVANIDDLNSLAFLDYLRNVALSGTQVFFATADETLSELFQRKFAVLGDHHFQTLHFSHR